VYKYLQKYVTTIQLMASVFVIIVLLLHVQNIKAGLFCSYLYSLMLEEHAEARIADL
jgi:hypothetical protein